MNNCLFHQGSANSWFKALKRGSDFGRTEGRFGQWALRRPAPARGLMHVTQRRELDMARNYHLVRRTIDWAHASVTNIDPEMRELVEIWETATGLSYLRCRAKLAAIAASNWSAIDRLDATLTVEQLSEITLAADDLLLISDDDDWYAPTVLSEVRACLPFDAALWPDAVWGVRSTWKRDGTYSLFLEAPFHRPLSDPGAFSMVKTNNYCVTGRFVRQRGLAGVQTHPDAVSSLTKPDLVRRELGSTLSLVNRHPCSITVMQTLQRAGGRAFEQLIQFFREAEPALDVTWAQPYAEQVRGIFISG